LESQGGHEVAAKTSPEETLRRALQLLEGGTQQVEEVPARGATQHRNLAIQPHPPLKDPEDIQKVSTHHSPQAQLNPVG